MNRILITGSSGYLGTALVRHFRQRDMYVLGVDVNEPPAAVPQEFVAMDICDPELQKRVQQFAPDTIVHAAFLMDPNANPETAHRINVRGSQNILAAASAVKPDRLLVVSSATAYGAWPDNPVPIHEDWPLRSREGFRYAADKVEVERLVKEFADQHSDIAVSTVRPPVIGSARMDNYLRRVMFEMPFATKLDGYDYPVQLVHEDDVVGAIDAILAIDGRGPYNVGPHDFIPVSQMGRETGRWTISIPLWLARLTHGCTGLLRLPVACTHKDYLYFARYPWVVSPERLIRETGYQFKYSSEDTLHEILGKKQTAESQSDIDTATV